MNTEFWLENWKANKIGFHQQAINPYLNAFWRQLGALPGDSVFVPLCGKSLDLLWLRNQGHSVIGVEISEMATEQFFTENNLAFTLVVDDDFRHYESDRLSLLQGDFFNLAPIHLQKVVAVYDRASLVALPAELRRRYVRHLTNILPAESRILLVTFEYDQAQMDGPPFSVDEAEVRMLYHDNFGIDLLLAQDILEKYPDFRARGLNKLIETVYVLAPAK
jgi:thiopurine S-methyltransferase